MPMRMLRMAGRVLRHAISRRVWSVLVTLMAPVPMYTSTPPPQSSESGLLLSKVSFKSMPVSFLYSVATLENTPSTAAASLARDRTLTSFSRRLRQDWRRTPYKRVLYLPASAVTVLRASRVCWKMVWRWSSWAF